MIMSLSYFLTALYPEVNLQDVSTPVTAMAEGIMFSGCVSVQFS